MDEEHDSSAAPPANHPESAKGGESAAAPGETQPQGAAPASAAGEANSDAAGPSKRPKYRFALLVVYRGTRYHGLQINPGIITVEHALCEALYKAGLISWDNWQDGTAVHKTGLNRAARTDKGVHAAGQVVTLKLMVEPEAEQEALDAINRHCPSDIRVISMVRVTKNFNAKNHCHRRTYEYFLPTFLMAPDPLSMVDPFQRGQHFRTAHASAQVAAARLRRARAAGKLPPAPEEATIRVFTRKAAPPAPAPAPQPAAVPAASPAVPTPAPVPASGAGAAAPSEAAASSAAPTTSPSPPASTPAATPAATEDNDAGPPPRHDLTDRVAVASDTTRLPVGIDVDVASVQQQHDWPDLYNHRISPSALAKLRAVAKRFTGTHNFHNYTRGKAPGDPSCARFIVDFKVHAPEVIENMEFVRLTVFGQSFMFNQIRKMVAAAVEVTRGSMTFDQLRQSLTCARVTVPVAPGEGLFLNKCFFPSYNRQHQGTHPSLDFDYDAVRAVKARFTQDLIHRHIALLEVKERPFLEWLRQVQEKRHVFTYAVKPALDSETNERWLDRSKQARQRGAKGGRQKRERRAGNEAEGLKGEESSAKRHKGFSRKGAGRGRGRGGGRGRG